MQLKKLLDTIPKTPGIYKMLNAEGRIIYVGKAKELNKRVKQYFKPDYAHSTRTRKLVENIADIKVIETDSELEAIILENNLIKQLQPKYNIIMKDDKSFVYIKITKETFPRIQIVRQIEKDGAKYIGPKTAQHKVKDTLKFLKKLFPFRHCNLNIEPIHDTAERVFHKVKVTNKVLKYPCLDYYIKRCIAPCIAKCTEAEYAEIIKNVTDFLEGRGDNILKNLTLEMQTQASAKEFEKAAKTRDKIQKIQDILQKQKVASVDQENTDIINYTVIQGSAYFNLFQIRDGILLQSENFTLKAEDLEESEHAEILSAFLAQYYELATDIPKEILIPHELTSNDLEAYISDQTNHKVKITIPKIGTKNRLLNMSLKNAKIYADRSRPSWKEESELTIKDTESLQQILKLNKPIKRLECYDISHLSGTDTVASMIVFKNGAPDKAHYRKFHVKTVQNKPDDFASMEEILTRRLLRIRDKFHQQNLKLTKAKKADDPLIQEKSQLIGVNTSKKDYTHFHILKKDQTIIGFGRIDEITPKIAILKAIGIIPEYQKQGYGQLLVRELLKKTKAKRTYIFCKEHLKNFYATCGFEEIRQIPKEFAEEKIALEKEFNEPLHYFVFDKLKLKEDKSFSEIPDLLLIDGGKGQLASALKVLKKLQIQIPVISLAKRLEEIFTPNSWEFLQSDAIQGNKEALPEPYQGVRRQKGDAVDTVEHALKKFPSHPIILDAHHPARRLLQRARDEAHRFAISFQKDLRSKKIKT